ncbi:DUF1761 domain-containing protein [Chachezhania sediminis]|uniref:DUF1761 domain-containing protein n=1 Tax=Chachezhania sediminis TaxID=2599291 RepID=UPI00131E3559|nr:DUF1761 domain-containing protein [Chachezhania sediminis]
MFHTIVEVANVLAATAAAFALGTVWYGWLSKQWLRATGIPAGADGRPVKGGSPIVFVIGFFLELLVAGMMRHVFAMAGINGLGLGILAGFGIGLFFITPWIAMTNLYAMRPIKLTLIDGGYAVISTTVMGFILALF